jgi:hypothetical protein
MVNKDSASLNPQIPVFQIIIDQNVAWVHVIALIPRHAGGVAPWAETNG